MATEKTINGVADIPESGWRSQQGQDMKTIWLDFTDGDIGYANCRATNAETVHRQLADLIECRAEFALEAAKPTKDGKTKWKLRDWPGKGKGEYASKLQVLSDPGDGMHSPEAGAPSTAPEEEVREASNEAAGVGGVRDPRPTPASLGDWEATMERTGKTRAQLTLEIRRRMRLLDASKVTRAQLEAIE